MYQGIGIVLKGVGGLYTVHLLPSSVKQPLDGLTVFARGRGALRQKGALLIGDRVRVLYDDTSFSHVANGSCVPSPDGTGTVIAEILPRRCELIRPPLANLDVLFVTAAAAAPDTDTETLDKLLCIAEFNHIEPILVVTKEDRDSHAADRLCHIYRLAGFPVFRTVGTTGQGVEALQCYIHEHLHGRIAAFSGASGVGKTTLLNRIFPDLGLQTGDISRKIARGKNTTRCVELYPLSDDPNSGFLADTPGFSMLDFERFHFFSLEDLPGTFREFSPYIGACRYRKCSHTKEDGCAILAAVKAGDIAPSRHRSYVWLYEILKQKHSW